MSKSADKKKAADVLKLPKEILIAGKMRKVPQSWEDINVRQYIRINNFKEFNEVEFMAIMLDVSSEEILDAPIEDLDMLVFPQIHWYMDDSADKFFERMSDEKNRYIPSAITMKRDGKDVTIIIPKDLAMKTFAQKIAAEQMLEKSKDDPFAVFADVVAIYLYPEWSGEKFDQEKAQEFKNSHIMELPISIAYPIGRFFLMKYLDLMNKKLLIWLENIPQKKRGQMSENSKNLSSLKQ